MIVPSPFTLKVDNQYVTRCGVVTTLTEDIGHSMIKSSDEFYYIARTESHTHYVYDKDTEHDYDIVAPYTPPHVPSI